ncbi:hypothetical protein [Sphingomonas echinoides]|uniref:hypothetical protein n=1 Tax=Sphingomonas echinoides TaxID=59803 RepID=UPI00241361A7|nr:hypothetical protein [Sphingomonas echinoides]
MTALIGLVQPHGAFLLTDGASFDADHNVRQIGSKVVELPGQNMAIAWSGYAMIHDLEAGVAAAGSTQREILSALPGIVQRMATANVAVGVRDGVPTPPLYLLVALWDAAADEPQLWAIHSCTQIFGPVYTPYTLIRVEQYGALGPQQQTVIFGRPVNQADPADFDVRRDGLTLLEAERAEPYEDGHYAVGGFAELTTVTADRVEKEILRRWDDPLGKPITP